MPGGPAPAGGFAPPPYAPPPRKSNWWIWLLGGCGCSAILLMLCCGGVSYWGFSKSMNVLGDLVKKEVEDNPDVKEHLGEINSITMNLAETTKEKQARGGTSNWIVFDAEGSKGDGQIIAESSPGAGTPFSKIELRLEDGKTFQIK